MCGRDLARQILTSEFSKTKCVVEIMHKKQIIITFDLLPIKNDDDLCLFLFCCCGSKGRAVNSMGIDEEDKSIYNGESKVWFTSISTSAFELIFRLTSFILYNAKLTTLASHIKYYL